MIKTVIRCANDMVMVFDEKGEQITQFQGQYEEVRRNILEAASPDTVFSYFLNTEPGIRDITRNEW
jgi:hypothetical protein